LECILILKGGIEFGCPLSAMRERESKRR